MSHLLLELVDHVAAAYVEVALEMVKAFHDCHRTVLVLGNVDVDAAVEGVDVDDHADVDDLALVEMLQDQMVVHDRPLLSASFRILGCQILAALLRHSLVVYACRMDQVDVVGDVQILRCLLHQDQVHIAMGCGRGRDSVAADVDEVVVGAVAVMVRTARRVDRNHCR